MKSIDVTFPADYGVATLAGKPATFEITVKAIKTAQTPAIDDDLGKTLGFEGLDEVRVLLAKQVQREYDQLSRMRLKRELLDRLAERASFPVPQGMVDAEFGAIWQRIEADRKTGSLDAEDAGKDDETLRTEYRAIAERRVRLGLLLSEIGRAANVTVGADEMTRAMRAEASRYPGPGTAGHRVLPQERAGGRRPARADLRGEGGRLRAGPGQAAGANGDPRGTLGRTDRDLRERRRTGPFGIRPR